MKQTIAIEGLADLDKALSEMSRSMTRNILLRVLKKAAQPMADAGEAMAPRLSGQLADSYTVTTKLSRRQRKTKKESMVEVYIGPTPHAKSVQTEFGNAHQAPHPHLRPAWDSHARPALDGIKDDTTVEIEKARKRVAAKAERLAAKMALNT